MKKFNTTAICISSLHYMVDLSSRLEKVREMIDEGDYFTINRARQYGKTTLLHALSENIKDKYFVVSLDFQQFSDSKFKDEESFSRAFASRFVKSFNFENNFSDEHLTNEINAMEEKSYDKNSTFELMELFDAISDICHSSDRKIVLIIDEVDSATNNQVFLDFLAQLRSDYISRMEHPTFQSVILAGVYDVKNLKQKIRPDDDRKVNSPWNIAADFDVDLSFSADDIAGMLRDYANEHEFAFDVIKAAKCISDYTGGYPFLVSRICQIIDENLLGEKVFEDANAAWSEVGIDEAARRLEKEKNTLFESLTAKLINIPELNSMVQRILFNGAEVPFVAIDPAIDKAAMFGFIKEEEGKAVISNRIFETVLYNFFLTTSKNQKSDIYQAGEIEKTNFIINGHLNMDKIIERFVVTFDDLYGDRDAKFLEEDGRKFFLLYLKPIINGAGNYYIEAQTRNNERTDVIVDYKGEQFVIELKIWRGNSYNERGEKQLSDYLAYYHLNKGYMISFCFNKNKKIGVNNIKIDDKILLEAVV